MHARRRRVEKEIQLVMTHIFGHSWRLKNEKVEKSFKRTEICLIKYCNVSGHRENIFLA